MEKKRKKTKKEKIEEKEKAKEKFLEQLNHFGVRAPRTVGQKEIRTLCFGRSVVRCCAER